MTNLISPTCSDLYSGHCRMPVSDARQRSGDGCYYHGTAGTQITWSSAQARAAGPLELLVPRVETGLGQTHRHLRDHDFYPPTDLPLPRPYGDDTATDGTVLHACYRLGQARWWVAELDPDTGEAFGYTSLGGPGTGSWGHFNLADLEELDAGRQLVERDLDWAPTSAGDADLPGNPA